MLNHNTALFFKAHREFFYQKYVHLQIKKKINGNSISFKDLKRIDKSGRLMIYFSTFSKALVQSFSLVVRTQLIYI